MKILAIDPGPEKSAFVSWDVEAGRIASFGKYPNEDLTAIIETGPGTVAIEMIASYGMAVGKEVFETCLWIGRFLQAAFYAKKKTHLIYRRDVKLHLCQSMKAKDSNIRMALIDKFGPPGTKKAPGITYGLSKDLWSAFAVAVTYSESQTSSQDRIRV